MGSFFIHKRKAHALSQGPHLKEGRVAMGKPVPRFGPC